MDILLIGWWWGNQESTSSTFWFQPVWGPRVRGQHTVNFFHLMGLSVSAKQLKGHGSEYYLSPWGGTKGPWLCLMANYYFFVLLRCFPLFLHFHTLITFILWNSGRPRNLKFLWKQEAGTGHGGDLSWEGLIGSCSVTLLPSSVLVWTTNYTAPSFSMPLPKLNFRLKCPLFPFPLPIQILYFLCTKFKIVCAKPRLTSSFPFSEIL